MVKKRYSSSLSNDSFAKIDFIVDGVYKDLEKNF